MHSSDYQNLAKLMELVGHTFREQTLLQEALTHPSVYGLSRSRQKKKTSSTYERLEFLGDRVLGLVIAHWLYELYPQEAEGALAKRHASLVNRHALKKVADTIGLENFLHYVRDKEAGPAINVAALSDAVESIIGALYLDGGMASAEGFIKRYWDGFIKVETAPADAKTSLQEFVQSKGLPLPAYNETGRSGPAHAPRFVVEVCVKGYAPVQAQGASKRDAEKEAARLFMQEIKSQ